MTDSHASAAVPLEDEPKTPMWLPALGAALFLSVGLAWAVSPSTADVVVGAAATPSAGAPSASAVVVPTPQPVRPAPSAAAMPPSHPPMGSALPGVRPGTAPLSSADQQKLRQLRLNRPAPGSPPHPLSVAPSAGLSRLLATPAPMIRTRFAPSPTGDLHLGGVWTALASWVVARRAGGRAVLRIEDIDTPRVLGGSQERILEDLAWLGFDWDEGPFLQSQRAPLYESAIAMLDAKGLVYPCDCSRAEIARAASAPHAGEESVYPGFCRTRDPTREMKRPPAVRVRVPDATISYEDSALRERQSKIWRVTSVTSCWRRGDGDIRLPTLRSSWTISQMHMTDVWCAAPIS